MVFDTATGKLLSQFDDEKTFEVLAFSPDGELLAGGGFWNVCVCDLVKGKALRQFDGHRGPVLSLSFSPDSKGLASASEDNTVLVWAVGK